MKTNKEGRFR